MRSTPLPSAERARVAVCTPSLSFSLSFSRNRGETRRDDGFTPRGVGRGAWGVVWGEVCERMRSTRALDDDDPIALPPLNRAVGHHPTTSLPLHLIASPHHLIAPPHHPIAPSHHPIAHRTTPLPIAPHLPGAELAGVPLVVDRRVELVVDDAAAAVLLEQAGELAGATAGGRVESEATVTREWN